MRTRSSLITQHDCDRCAHRGYSRKAIIQLGKQFFCIACAIRVAQARKAANQCYPNQESFHE